MKIEDFLTETFLFSGIKRETVTHALSEMDYEVKLFAKNDSIYSPHEYEKKVGFVIHGECEVNRAKSDGGAVILNVLGPSDSFGIMAVLSCDEEFPTTVTAKRDCKILFISDKSFLKIIKKYPTVAMNVIRFLSNKINFLNSKVATFSSDSVEEKLASFLLCEYKARFEPSFAFSPTRAAEKINVGRASLYRALSKFEDLGILCFQNKKIIISDLQGLERISK